MNALAFLRSKKTSNRTIILILIFFWSCVLIDVHCQWKEKESKRKKNVNAKLDFLGFAFL